MLLQYLYELAERRKREGDPTFADSAFVRKPIRWIIQIDSEGRMSSPGPLDTMGETKRAMEYDKPQTGEAKNSGGRADFLADTITGVFGLDTEPEKYLNQEDTRKRRNANNTAKYEDFWQQIQQAYNQTKHQNLLALLHFNQATGVAPPFLRWGTGKEPKASEKPAWWITNHLGNETRLGNDYLSFEVNGKFLLLDDEVIRPYWRSVYQEISAKSEGEAESGLCLITGVSNIPIARTHLPKIQGVPNTQGSGATLISFEKSSPALSSFGWKQGQNAPTSIEATTAYCNALNWLLHQNNHRLRIGQMSLCFWARDTEDISDFFAAMLERPQPESVREFLTSPWAGVDRALLQHDQFYSVALAGNAGRIVVRHWMQTTVAAARENLRQWFADLQIEPYGDPAVREKRTKKDQAEDGSTGTRKEVPQPLALYSLAMTTVRDQKDVQSETLTQLYRAALEGTAPSLALLKPILNRLKVDLARNGSKALFGVSRFALLRLLLNRNCKGDTAMIEPQMFETDDPAYNCGRLLAVLAEAQQKAHDYKLEGAGVAERYFGTACAAPGSVFPLLIRLNRHHLNAISKSDRYKGHERFLEASIQNILALFRPGEGNQPPGFPRVLNLQAQGRFALGFYQQQAADDAARRSARSNNNQP